ncbi:zinc-binding dehydrogenase [Paenibacillus peoriae]|uniref:zinc-binding dehydrogenase n=1 Tax=Paenibacillus peoriae TaxID=59893 RepID=UPI00026C623C|nr:zinc-binding dehydrogenase [Paenibacillus peoriae]MEC0184608.1 zinc-binding dehydrogenase [Paenibacillus peoriae]
MAKTMKAWVTDGKGGISFSDVPVPTPAPDQALIECKSTTIARGEIRSLPYLPGGRVLGLDLAGVVIKEAADGSGPPVGSRVIAMTGFSGGGWGQFAALPASTLGVIPDELSWKEAAVLPNAGLTALYSVRHAGFLVGLSVLVTGATGAVGRIAAQLAQHAGAEVTGSVSRAERAEALKSLDLNHIAVANDTVGPFDFIIDTLGGGSLSHALKVVGPEGVIVTMGGGEGFDAPSEQAIIPLGWFGEHPGARVEAENVAAHVLRRTGVARDLGILAKLVVDNRLDLDIAEEVSWREAPRVVDALKAGQTKGRVAILID